MIFKLIPLKSRHSRKKEHKDGSLTYYHQMLSGVLIHPEKKAVIPIAPEPIVQQDGSKKNDCERNAAIRF